MHDEAGVDPERPVARAHFVGVGVTTQPVLGLVERGVRGRTRGVGGQESRDAGADQGDPCLPSLFRPHTDGSERPRDRMGAGTRASR